MSYEGNKKLARTWFDEVMNNRDPSAIDGAYSANYRYAGPRGETVRGLEDTKRIVQALYEAMPDRVSTVEMQIAEGDLVVTRWVSRGTQTGPLMGRSPTNEPVEVHGITISRILDDEIIEDWEIIQVVG